MPAKRAKQVTRSKVNLSKRNLKAGTKGALTGPLRRVVGRKTKLR